MRHGPGARQPKGGRRRAGLCKKRAGWIEASVAPAPVPDPTAGSAASALQERVEQGVPGLGDRPALRTNTPNSSPRTCAG